MCMKDSSAKSGCGHSAISKAQVRGQQLHPEQYGTVQQELGGAGFYRRCSL